MGVLIWTIAALLLFNQDFSTTSALARIRFRNAGTTAGVLLNNCSNVLLAQEKHGLTIIFPQMITRSEEDEPISAPIDTYNPLKQEYITRVIIEFYYKGSRYKFKLRHNNKLVASGLHAKGNQGYLQKQHVNNCYYQGTRAKTSHNDFVTLSTCDGLRGIIDLDGVTHYIYPYRGSSNDEERSVMHRLDPETTVQQVHICRPHVITMTSPTKERMCANQSGQWAAFEELHRIDLDWGKAASLKANKRVKRNLETKYIELALVMDHRLLQQFDLSKDETTDFILQVTNMVDMYYQRLNIRVGLLYQEFWLEQDDITVTSNVRETLQNFLVYAEEGLKNVNYDVAHLVTGINFDGDSIGMAVPEAICTTRAVAVVSLPASKDPQELASIIAHMIGHGIGLHHDTQDCACSNIETGCIMGEIVRSKSPKLFSSCSVARLDYLTKIGLGACLLEEPAVNSYQQFCGNGHVERGEQCDCGPPKSCKDTCCEASTCLLKSWAKCRTGTCCEGCLPKLSNEICRSAKGECDAPEHCDGVRGECADDLLIQDGEPCAGGIGFCYQGRCPLKERQCQAFWGSQSSSANEKCYISHNLQASASGHCGINSSGRYKRCQIGNALCGLLQCEGGEERPLLPELGYQKTAVGVSGDGEYQCKTTSISAKSDQVTIGMVSDGTKCGENSMCLAHACVDISSLGVPVCPRGNGNRTCSGNGTCTTGRTCYCHKGFGGELCDEIIPTQPAPIVYSESTTANSSVGPMQIKWMIIASCSVAAAIIFGLLIGLFCYRRRAPTNKLKKRQRNERDAELDRNRTISFGQTPSYKNDGLGAKRKRRRRRRKSSSSEEETDSDERNQPLPTLHHDVIIPEELSRQPERGILKKSVSQNPEEELCSSQCSCSDSGSCSCSDEECKPDTLSNSSRRDQTSEIPPPIEFDTTIYISQSPLPKETSNDVSPANSEEMKSSATEADQYYRQFSTYDRYALHRQQQPPSQHPDSATDSAIDMPGDGSVSTINEIPPAYHSSYLLKHSPPSSDYSEVPAENIGDYRPARRYGRSQSSRGDYPAQPVIHEQQKSNHSLLSVHDSSDKNVYTQAPVLLATFQPVAREKVSPNDQNSSSTNSPSKQRFSRSQSDSPNAVIV